MMMVSQTTRWNATGPKTINATLVTVAETELRADLTVEFGADLSRDAGRLYFADTQLLEAAIPDCVVLYCSTCLA